MASETSLNPLRVKNSTSKVKQKMVYAASKDALRKKLVGVSTEIQATDLSEVAHEVVLEKLKNF